MTTAKRWSGETIEAALAAQGIALAAGRAERLARGVQALLEASAADPLRVQLEFDTEPTGFAFAMRRCKPD